MGKEYTRKEVETINRAWSQMEYIADMEHTIGRKLADALKYERRERSSLTAARALLVECAANVDGDGNTRPTEYTPADICCLSDGCATAFMVGAYWRSREHNHYTAKEYARFAPMAADAARANHASTRRMLDAIKG
jgi:hypothetical protein